MPCPRERRHSSKRRTHKPIESTTARDKKRPETKQGSVQDNNGREQSISVAIYDTHANSSYRSKISGSGGPTRSSRA